jgi:hypothetical protein
MKKLLVALSLIIGLNTFAQNEVEEKRTVNEAFSGIKISDGIQLSITQSNDVSINLTASDQSYMNEIITAVENGVLIISTKQKKWGWSNNKNRWVKAKVSLPKLNSLKINDGCTVKNTNQFNVEDLSISCNDGSSVKLNEFNANKLTLTVKDGSSMVLTGKTTILDVEVSDGSSYDGDDFVSETCVATAKDGSSVKLNVTKDINASAYDGSSIRYEGTPSIKKTKARDGSSIKRVS